MIGNKWMWMMEWCRSNNLPPANPEFWEFAEKEYNAAHPKDEAWDIRMKRDQSWRDSGPAK